MHILFTKIFLVKEDSDEVKPCQTKLVAEPTVIGKQQSQAVEVVWISDNEN